jgi:hypothetical protein
MQSTLSKILDARLSRYAIAASAVATAIPAQAAPITVVLPNPVDIRFDYELDLDQDGNAEVFFSGLGSTWARADLVRPGALAASGSFALQLTVGAQLFSADSFSLWGPSAAANMSFNFAQSPTFLGIGFATTNGGYNRLGFAQFDGPDLYGWAWEEADSITTFDLRTASAVPEPATGASPPSPSAPPPSPPANANRPSSNAVRQYPPHVRREQ